LLSSFPQESRIFGVDISSSAVESARLGDRFSRYRSAQFEQIVEDDPEALPEGPFDLILSSHCLEHVPDDRAALKAIRSRLRPGGIFALFVPIEEPDYISFHLRSYSLQSISERVAQAGLRLLHVEGSLQVNGHIWKLLTIPSRRAWPLLGPLVDAFRLTLLSCLPYPLLRFMDSCLHRFGFGPRQALLIATLDPKP